MPAALKWTGPQKLLSSGLALRDDIVLEGWSSPVDDSCNLHGSPRDLTSITQKRTHTCVFEQVANCLPFPSSTFSTSKLKILPPNPAASLVVNPEFWRRKAIYASWRHDASRRLPLLGPPRRRDITVQPQSSACSTTDSTPSACF